MKADDVSIVVGLLHDVLEDTHHDEELIAQQFGGEVADLVDGLTKIGKFSYVLTRGVAGRDLPQDESSRCVRPAGRPRQLADRLHNMRTLQYLRRRSGARSPGNPRQIYSPIANRLGWASWKGNWKTSRHASRP